MVYLTAHDEVSHSNKKCSTLNQCTQSNVVPPKLNRLEPLIPNLSPISNNVFEITLCNLSASICSDFRLNLKTRLNFESRLLSSKGQVLSILFKSLSKCNIVSHFGRFKRLSQVNRV